MQQFHGPFSLPVTLLYFYFFVVLYKYPLSLSRLSFVSFVLNCWVLSDTVEWLIMVV
jgi:hypothetical protein